MRVLIVSSFAWGSSAIGAQRTRALFDSLKGHGDDACLLTGEASGPALLRVGLPPKEAGRGTATGKEAVVPPRLLRDVRQSQMWHAAASAKRAVLDWPDPRRERVWYRQADRLLSGPLASDEYDVVVSSGPPWVVHKVALKVAKQQGIPWAADYRDLWTNGPYYPHPDWRRAVENRVERRWLTSASGITAVAPGLCRELAQLAPRVQTTVIWNGFSGDEMNTVEALDLGPGRHWVYAGTWYERKRDPRPVLDALGLRSKLEPTTLHLVGGVPAWVNREIEERGLAKQVVRHGEVDRARALAIVQGADIALVLGWNDPRDRDVVGGKIFELIGLRRPVIALAYPSGSLADVVKRYGFGHVAHDTDSILRCAADLTERLDRGQRPDESVVSRFERESQLKRWREVLTDLRR